MNVHVYMYVYIYKSPYIYIERYCKWMKNPSFPENMELVQTHTFAVSCFLCFTTMSTKREKNLVTLYWYVSTHPKDWHQSCSYQKHGQNQKHYTSSTHFAFILPCWTSIVPLWPCLQQGQKLPDAAELVDCWQGSVRFTQVLGPPPHWGGHRASIGRWRWRSVGTCCKWTSYPVSWGHRWVSRGQVLQSWIKTPKYDREREREYILLLSYAKVVEKTARYKKWIYLITKSLQLLAIHDNQSIGRWSVLETSPNVQIPGGRTKTPAPWYWRRLGTCIQSYDHTIEKLISSIVK